MQDHKSLKVKPKDFRANIKMLAPLPRRNSSQKPQKSSQAKLVEPAKSHRISGELAKLLKK